MDAPSINKKNQKLAPKGKHSFLYSLGICLLLVVIILALAECIGRVAQTRAQQPIRSLGLFHTQFETKWFRLQDYVKKYGGVDVLLMGNSMVNTGIDPNDVAEAYAAKTGNRLRIYNFGVEGMDIYTNSELAELLVQEFHPKTILFFTEMREYGPQTDTTVPDRFKSAAWFQYKLGNSSLEAWVFDHSAALQYLLPYRNWSRADFPDTMLKDLYRYGQTTAAGYEPDHAYGKDLDTRTNPNDPAQKPLFDLYRNYTPDQESLNDLAAILKLHDEDVQIVVTEMPVYPTFYDYFGGETVHQAFLNTIKDLAEQNQDQYIPPIDPDLIPLVGRVDNHHLNFEGAPVYSELLGDELGDLCLNQNQCLANEAAR